jgi:hypothetical protein
MAEASASTIWKLEPERTVWAIQGWDFREPIHKSLLEGQGRFGWSYVETADLHKLAQRIASEGFSALSADEKDCYQSFLLEMQPGDWVVYINVPTYGKCTLARVDRPYFFEFDREIGDLGHRFGVDPATVRTFDRNDARVHPRLRASLKLRGRYWRIWARDEFQALLETLAGTGPGLAGRQRTSTDQRKLLREELKVLFEQACGALRRTHPNRDLEVLLKPVLQRMPGVVNVKPTGGPRDRGADLVVTYRTGLPIAGLEKEEICVVQVKAYEGELSDLQAVDDIRRAFEHYNDAAVGLVLSTADRVSKEFEEALQKLEAEGGKRVVCVYGADLARLVLRYLPDEGAASAESEGRPAA